MEMMRPNKIILNNRVLLDLTADTVDESKVLLGERFHRADGMPATGSFSLQEKTIQVGDFSGVPSLEIEVVPDENAGAMSKVTVVVPDYPDAESVLF